MRKTKQIISYEVIFKFHGTGYINFLPCICYLSFEFTTKTPRPRNEFQHSWCPLFQHSRWDVTSNRVKRQPIRNTINAMTFAQSTFPESKSSHLKRWHPKRKSSLPNQQFSACHVFEECTLVYCLSPPPPNKKKRDACGIRGRSPFTSDQVDTQNDTIWKGDTCSKTRNFWYPFVNFRWSNFNTIS